MSLAGVHARNRTNKKYGSKNGGPDTSISRLAGSGRTDWQHNTAVTTGLAVLKSPAVVGFVAPETGGDRALPSARPACLFEGNVEQCAPGFARSVPGTTGVRLTSIPYCRGVIDGLQMRKREVTPAALGRKSFLVCRQTESEWTVSYDRWATGVRQTRM